MKFSIWFAAVAILVLGFAIAAPGSVLARPASGHGVVLANGYDTPPAPGR